MPEYPRSPFEKTGTSITPSVDGDVLDATPIGETTPAGGSFTTLKVTTDPTDVSGVGDRDFNDGRYCLESNNLSDVDNVATAFGNIKQVATDSATGVSELATDAETVTGTATDRVATPANITAKMLAPGSIGVTTPSSGNFTTLEATGQLHGDLINNQMVSKVTFDILGLMTDPRFLNLQCEDPGAGTMTDVSGQGHDGTYQGSMTTGDRISKGMGWAIDPDGDNDYIYLSNHNDFSFGDGTNDEAVTWFCVFEILQDTTYRMVISKYDKTTGTTLLEWLLQITNNGRISMSIADNSVGVTCSRETDDLVSTGTHSVVATYDGAGGATAGDTIKIYVDGVLAASTANNNASYVAMENLNVQAWIGARVSSGGIPEGFFDGDISLIGIDGSEWSPFDVHRFHQLCKGLYAI